MPWFELLQDLSSRLWDNAVLLPTDEVDLLVGELMSKSGQVTDDGTHDVEGVLHWPWVCCLTYPDATSVVVAWLVCWLLCGLPKHKVHITIDQLVLMLSWAWCAYLMVDGVGGSVLWVGWLGGSS